jgi:hypothetical protein
MADLVAASHVDAAVFIDYTHADSAQLTVLLGVVVLHVGKIVPAGHSGPLLIVLAKRRWLRLV